MGISGFIHGLKMKRVLASISMVCMFTLAVFCFRYVLNSDVSLFMPERGSSVETPTEANVGLTVNISVTKISERRFGGYDSHSSVMLYPACSGGAADSALFISLQLHMGGIHPHPGPPFCVNMCDLPWDMTNPWDTTNGDRALLEERGDEAIGEPEVTALRWVGE